MKKLLLNFIASVFCFFLAVAMTLAAEYTDATDNLTVEWLAGDGTDIYYNLTGDNVVAIRSERGHATVNITGTGSRVVDNCSDDGCPTQYFNGQFSDTFSGADGTTLAQHYPPWYGVRWPSTASNCVITSGKVACTPAEEPATWQSRLSNVVPNPFGTSFYLWTKATIDNDTYYLMAFKITDLTDSEEDFCYIKLDETDGSLVIYTVIAGVETSVFSAMVTYSADAQLEIWSSDGGVFNIYYDDVRIGDVTIDNAELSGSSVAFYSESATTVFSEWSFGRFAVESLTGSDSAIIYGSDGNPIGVKS